MTTLGTMVDRIADELARDDLKSQTEAAIRSAINHYSGERWWFNESLSATICVSSGTDTYALPANFERLDSYTLIQPSTTLFLPIVQQTYEDISAWQTGLVTGQPTDFCIYEESIMLFPAPDTDYVTMLSYVTSVSTLTTTTCTNAFMTYGEELIRSRARADILINFLRDDGVTAEYLTMLQAGFPFYSARERGAYGSLRHRTTRRLTTGRLRGSDW